MNKGNIIKSLIPRRVRRISRDLLGTTALYERIDLLHERIDLLHQLILESKEDIRERSKTRWRLSEPTITDLTWRREVTGDNFISKVSSYGVFSPEKNVLEVGPGYGRLLKSCLEQDIPFNQYVGVDISIVNVKYLQEKFPRANIHIIHGDVEKVSFDERFYVVLSSLTFKHLFPSFEKALRNIVDYVNPGGVLFFDLIEGKRRYFETDGVTFIRWYTRSDILEILGNVSLELVAFDRVQHDPDHCRLLVVARKPK